MNFNFAQDILESREILQTISKSLQNIFYVLCVIAVLMFFNLVVTTIGVVRKRRR